MSECVCMLSLRENILLFFMVSELIIICNWEEYKVNCSILSHLAILSERWKNERKKDGKERNGTAGQCNRGIKTEMRDSLHRWQWLIRTVAWPQSATQQLQRTTKMQFAIWVVFGRNADSQLFYVSVLLVLLLLLGVCVCVCASMLIWQRDMNHLQRFMVVRPNVVVSEMLRATQAQEDITTTKRERNGEHKKRKTTSKLL